MIIKLWFRQKHIATQEKLRFYLVSPSPPFLSWINFQSFYILYLCTLQTRDETYLPPEWPAHAEAFFHTFTSANAGVGGGYFCHTLIALPKCCWQNCSCSCHWNRLRPTSKSKAVSWPCSKCLGETDKQTTISLLFFKPVNNILSLVKCTNILTDYLKWINLYI